MAAARAVERREAAGQRLDQRVRARVVAARRDVGVVAAKLVRERAGGERTDGRDPREGLGRTPDEGQLEALRVEMLVEPAEDVCALVRVVGPARGDEAELSPRDRLAGIGRVEDQRVGRVPDDHRLRELDPQLAMSVEAEPRLGDRRVRQVAVDLLDPAVRAVVEPAIDADRAVHAVHHPAVRPGEAAQPPEVEVERVEEADGRAARDAVQLDDEPAALELRDERAQELVASARRRGSELVEQREVRAAAASVPNAVDLGRELAPDRTPRAADTEADGSESPAERHAGTVVREAVERRS